MKTNKPWGYEDLLYQGPSYVLKKLFMSSGESCSLHFHNVKHETMLVFSGKLKIEIGESKSSLIAKDYLPGDIVIIEPGVIHRMTAIEDCIYFEASTPELDDVVRIEDRYGRAEQDQ